MLAEMPGKPFDLMHKRHGLAQAQVIGIKADLLQPLTLQIAVGEKAPKLRTERADRVLAQPHGAAHLTNGTLAPIMDHSGAEPCPFATIAFINVLDHLFTAFMFEIHVDVGWLIARLRDETLKHHRAHLRAYARDAKAEAHHRIGRRSTPLAEDATRPGKGHHVMHCQKVRLIVQPPNEIELMLYHCAHALTRTAWIAPAQPLIGQPAQAITDGFIARKLAWVFVAQLIKRKGEALGNLARPMHSTFMRLKKAQHFRL